MFGMVANAMAGYMWSERQITSEMREVPGDLWCVRNSFCSLMRWPKDSAEWSSFVEAPMPADMDRLAAHLRLRWFDPEHFGLFTQKQQIELRSHPGVACYNLHRTRASHCQYQPDLRRFQILPNDYYLVDPDLELFRIVLDPDQPPHEWV